MKLARLTHRAAHLSQKESSIAELISVCFEPRDDSAKDECPSADRGHIKSCGVLYRRLQCRVILREELLRGRALWRRNVLARAPGDKLPIGCAGHRRRVARKLQECLEGLQRAGDAAVRADKAHGKLPGGCNRACVAELPEDPVVVLGRHAAEQQVAEVAQHGHEGKLLLVDEVLPRLSLVSVC